MAVSNVDIVSLISLLTIVKSKKCPYAWRSMSDSLARRSRLPSYWNSESKRTPLDRRPVMLARRHGLGARRANNSRKRNGYLRRRCCWATALRWRRRTAWIRRCGGSSAPAAPRRVLPFFLRCECDESCPIWCRTWRPRAFLRTNFNEWV